MYVGVVTYLVSMEVLTIVIASINMLCASFYDSSCDVTKWVLSIAIDRERRYIFAVYISVEPVQPFRFTGALGAGDAFSFES